MAKKQSVSLTVDPELLVWINGEIRKKRFASQSHAVEYSLTFVKNLDYSKGISLDIIESDPQLRKVAPFFHVESIDGNTIFLKDDSKDETIELQIRDSELYCINDSSKRCVHIGFAWALENIRAALRDHGKKSPR